VQVGLTILAGWIGKERNTLNGIVPPPPARTCIPLDEYAKLQAEQQQAASASAVAAAVAAGTAATTPASFDWRDKGLVTPIKFQGECRSCWAFAAAAAIETLWAQKTKVLLDVSPQAFIDCQNTAGFYGCGGALPMLSLLASKGLCLLVSLSRPLPAHFQRTVVSPSAAQLKQAPVPGVHGRWSDLSALHAELSIYLLPRGHACVALRTGFQFRLLLAVTP